MKFKVNYPKICLEKNTLSYTYIDIKEGSITLGCELAWKKINLKIGDILKYNQRGYKNRYYKITSILKSKETSYWDRLYQDKFKFRIITGDSI